MGDVFARLQSFLASPFKGEDGDLLDWVMLVGITVALAILWSRVITRFTE